MRNRHRRTIPIALAAALAGIAPAAVADGWSTYANARFGAVVDYPDRFSVRDAPPENGDGQRFFTRDRRAQMAVYGSYKVDGETMRELMDSARQAGVAYTFADVRPDSYALSGTRGARILYQRCIRSRHERGIVNCVDLEYPAAEAGAWDAIVTRISRSLRSGRVS